LDGRPSRHVALDFKPAIRHLTAIDRGLAGIFERGTRTARNGCEDGLAPPMRDASLPKRAPNHAVEKAAHPAINSR
jgi:hypothetical protein